MMFRTAAHTTETSSQANNVTASKPLFFQPKLTINEPDDVYEQEADAMADKVMRMSIPAADSQHFFAPASNYQSFEEGRGEGIQRKCAHCEEEEKLQRKEKNAIEIEENRGLENYIGSLPDSGNDLPPATKDFFESRMGYDFSKVRIHNDSVAAKSAESINALAYTSGNNIVFNRSQYSPESEAGKRLLAHELTHVVQQNSNIQFKLIQKVPCTSGASCGLPICGAPGSFNVQEEAAEAPARATRGAQVAANPVAVTQSGHGRRATSLTTLAAQQSLPLALVHGIFVDMDMSANTGAFSDLCNSFVGWVAPNIPPAGTHCVFVHDSDELEAQTFLTTTNATIRGLPRAEWLRNIIMVLTHELQHVQFLTRAQPALSGVSCLRNDVIFTDSTGRGFTLNFFLGELTAIMSEFPTLLEFHAARTSNYTQLMTALKIAWSAQIENCSEGIRGILTSMRCHCSCTDINAYIVDTQDFTASSRGWTRRQKNVFRELMMTYTPTVNWPTNTIT